MSEHTHYFCPHCEGLGEYTIPCRGKEDIERSCIHCDGSGVMKSDDMDAGEIDGARPWTQSKRRWVNRWGFVALNTPDPLVYVANHRSGVGIHKTGGSRYTYQMARERLRRSLAHTYAGLMQADMLARATMCETAGDRAVTAWRKAS